MTTKRKVKPKSIGQRIDVYIKRIERENTSLKEELKLYEELRERFISESEENSLLRKKLDIATRNMNEPVRYLDEYRRMLLNEIDKDLFYKEQIKNVLGRYGEWFINDEGKPQLR